MLKRFLSIITISLIITGSFFSVYNFKYPVYADPVTDEWMNVTTNQQLVEAFRYYCKSRDLTIEGSLADGVTSFTTKTFNGLCDSLGIDMTALQAHLKYKTDSNLGLQFLFDREGISLYNQIFAQFLQDNELEVGDTVDDMVYSGKYFTDADGHSCLVYIKNNGVTSGNSKSAVMLAEGTFYLYDWPYFDADYAGSTLTVAVTSTQNMSFKFSSALTNLNTNREVTMQINSGARNGLDSWYRPTVNDEFSRRWIGFPAVIYRVDTDKLYAGYYRDDRFFDNPDTFELVPVTEILQPSNYLQPCNIYITTNNSTINNNNYEGDTIINNNGDTNYYPDNPDDPDLPPSNPTIPDSGGWQDFDLPDMPNDWLIYGMEKKFPFDIPFNILFALSLLNHEPEIPKFEGDIDLQVCTWHYDIDLTPFDDIATILRKFEVLAFIIGLAILTKNLINWG